MDGLSLRAGHPESNIVEIHGDLWTLKCERGSLCGYKEENMNDPVVPALKVEEAFPDEEEIPSISYEELPHCPKCDHLLRPGVVFFNEQLPSSFTFPINVDVSFRN